MVSAATASKPPATAISLQQQQQQEQQHQLQLLQQQHQSQLQQCNAINDFLLNGGSSHSQVGRQGAIKDVKSIIDDYRQKHPETVPRRGRRLKGTIFYTEDGAVSSSPRIIGGDDDQTIFHQQLIKKYLRLLLLTQIEGNSRPSSRESSQSNSNFMGSTTLNASAVNVSLNDVLLEFAKFTQSERLTAAANAAAAASSSPLRTTDINHTSTPIIKAQPGYPEVTLHPVSALLDSTGTAQASVGGNGGNNSNNSGSHSNSLLHGILTKVYNESLKYFIYFVIGFSFQNTVRPSVNFSGYTSFSPTLARLLTAPERMTQAANAAAAAANGTTYTPTNHLGHQQQNNTGIINLTKSQSEITITPVLSAASVGGQQTLLQQQLQRQIDARMKSEMFMVGICYFFINIFL